MNGNWGKVILFSILFGVLGFILGRVCSGSCGTSGCGPDGKRGEACMHGGMKGDCDMHGEKGKCCTMKGDSAMDHHGMDHDHAMMDSSAVAH